MGRFWRQWLLVGSIITYAGLCVVMAGFANVPMPSPSPAGTLMTQVKAPEPIKIKQGRM
jgi:hypothetical protein